MSYQQEQISIGATYLCVEWLMVVGMVTWGGFWIDRIQGCQPHLHSTGIILCVCTQPMRDGVTMKCCLSLAGCKHKMIFVCAPCQWETTLQCNVVSHWLGANIKWSLIVLMVYIVHERLWGTGDNLFSYPSFRSGCSGGHFDVNKPS